MSDPVVLPRARHTRAWAITGAGAAIIALVVGAQLVANLLYDNAEAEHTARLTLLSQEQQTLNGTRASAREAVDSTASIFGADTGSLITTETRAQLTTQLETTQATLLIADETAGESLARSTPKPLWPWELYSASQKLTADAAHARTLTKTVLADDSALSEADTALREQVSAALDVAIAAVPSIEQQNVWARTGDVIALREASTALTRSAKRLTSETATHFATLEATVAGIRASAQDELAQKSGWLYDTRLEVENFARSISGGVLLDFDWTYLVNGYGEGGSAGGTATWNSASGGFSTITLSDSVAEMWPSDVARALVTHEVGHAISSKCWEMFNWEDADANEDWATAWALSWGETADGNGVSLYGHPPQSLIDTAATCR